MHCREIVQHLDAYLEGAACAEVRAHLSACRSCRTLLAHCQQTVQVYRRQCSPPLPAAVHKRLMERVGKSGPPARSPAHPS